MFASTNTNTTTTSLTNTTTSTDTVTSTVATVSGLEIDPSINPNDPGNDGIAELNQVFNITYENFPDGRYNDPTINADELSTGNSPYIEVPVDVMIEVEVPVEVLVDIESGDTVETEIDPIAISVIQDIESTVEIQMEVPVGEESSYGGTVVSTATAPGS